MYKVFGTMEDNGDRSMAGEERTNWGRGQEDAGTYKSNEDTG